MPRNYSQLTLKQLFSMGGQFCAFPDCTTPTFTMVAGQPVLTGEIAHIEASAEAGPRGNPALSESDRGGYANLLLLCPTHHTLVDKSDSSFSVEQLREWKATIARATADRLAVGSTEVSFAELTLVCDAFSEGFQAAPSTSMNAVEVATKMAANDLTSGLTMWMTSGLAQAGNVADFINRQAQLSPGYPGRLRGGFLDAYNESVDAGLHGDDLFSALVTFGSEAVLTPQADANRIWVATSASLAVVCHLFEICDLFEPPA